MVGMIRQNGGTVLTGAEVSKLCLSGNEIRTVEINHSEQLESRYVISSLHPFNTLSLVEKSPLIRKATLSRLQHLPNSYGLFSLYLLQKRESTRYCNRNLFCWEIRMPGITPGIPKIPGLILVWSRCNPLLSRNSIPM